METNGVLEYQERHKKRLNQAVDNRLDVEYKLFGLTDTKEVATQPMSYAQYEAVRD